MIQDGDNFNEEGVLEEGYDHYQYLRQKDKKAAQKKEAELVAKELRNQYWFNNDIARKVCDSLLTEYGTEVQEKVMFFRTMISKANEFQIQELINNINKQFDLELSAKSYRRQDCFNPVPLMYVQPESVDEEDVLDTGEERKTFLGFYTNCYQVEFYRMVNLICEGSKFTDLVNSYWVFIYRDLIKQKCDGQRIAEAELSRRLNTGIKIRGVLDPIESIDCFINFDEYKALSEKEGSFIEICRDFLRKEDNSFIVDLIDDLIELCSKSYASEVNKINEYSKKVFNEEILKLSEYQFLYEPYFNEFQSYELNESLISKNYHLLLGSLEEEFNQENHSTISQAFNLQKIINLYYRVSSLNKLNQQIFDKYKLPPFYSFKNTTAFYGYLDFMILNLFSQHKNLEDKISSLLDCMDIKTKHDFENFIEANRKVIYSDSRGLYHRLLEKYCIYDENMNS